MGQMGFCNMLALQNRRHDEILQSERRARDEIMNFSHSARLRSLRSCIQIPRGRSRPESHVLRPSEAVRSTV